MRILRFGAACYPPSLARAPFSLPELPEVETVRRGALPHLLHRKVRCVTLARTDLRWPIPVQAVEQLKGRTGTQLLRRSKYLLWHFDGPGQPVLLIHLGMSGRLFVDVLRHAQAEPEWRKHEHWRMHLGDRLVRFVDARRFGVLDVVAAADLPQHKLLAHLGPEPLEPEFAAPWLFAATRGRKIATKVLLMDSKLLVGVGNIYASEACWRAGVRPTRRAGRLTRAECGALVLAIKAVLQAAIHAGGTSLRDYVGVAEDAGSFAQQLAVYDRAGQPCRRCGARIKRTVDGGRSTYWCAGCQR